MFLLNLSVSSCWLLFVNYISSCNKAPLCVLCVWIINCKLISIYVACEKSLRQSLRVIFSSHQSKPPSPRGSSIVTTQPSVENRQFAGGPVLVLLKLRPSSYRYESFFTFFTFVNVPTWKNAREQAIYIIACMIPFVMLANYVALLQNMISFETIYNLYYLFKEEENYFITS